MFRKVQTGNTKDTTFDQIREITNHLININGMTFRRYIFMIITKDSRIDMYKWKPKGKYP